MEILVPWGLRSFTFSGEIIHSKEVERRFEENSDFLFPFRFPRSEDEFRGFVGVSGSLVEADLPFSLYVKGEGIYYEIRAEIGGDYIEFIAKGAGRFSGVIRDDGEAYGILKLVERVIGGRLVGEGGGFRYFSQDGVIVGSVGEVVIPRTEEEMRRFCIGERRGRIAGIGFWSFLARMEGIQLKLFTAENIPSWVKGRLERIRERGGVVSRGKICELYVNVGSEAWGFIKGMEEKFGIRLAFEWRRN